MELSQSLSPLFLAEFSSHPAAAGDVRVAGPDGTVHIFSQWSWPRVEALRSRQLIEGAFGAALDAMGRGSAAAQALKAPITSLAKLAHSADRVYLHCTLRPGDASTINGLLRTGSKRLFIRDEVGSIAEIEPRCVLDFYVHESLQRAGLGRQLFEFMLALEGVPPARFGYDRPSAKLLAFLGKHYGLVSFVPQNNNFVVFRKYFSKQDAAEGAGRSGRAGRAWGQNHQSEASPARAVPAGARSSTHSSSVTIAPVRGFDPPSHPSVPSPTKRGAPSPRSHLNVQGGQMSRVHAATAKVASPSHAHAHARGVNNYAALQASPPAGQAAFDFDAGDARLLRFDQQDDPLTERYLAQQQQQGRGSADDGEYYGRADERDYEHAREVDQQQQREYECERARQGSRGGGSGRRSPGPSHSRHGGTTQAASASGALSTPWASHNEVGNHRGNHAPSSSSYGRGAAAPPAAAPASSLGRGPASEDHPGHYRRSTPPEGASRLARAGANVLGGPSVGGGGGGGPMPRDGDHSHSHSGSLGRSGSSAHFGHGQGQGQQRDQRDQRDQRERAPLPVTQYHQHNIITGYVDPAGEANGSNSGAGGGGGAGFNPARQPRPAAASFLPDGHLAPVAHPGELAVGRVPRSGVAARPLYDPVAAPSGGLRAVDHAIAERERAIAAKEAALAAGPSTRYAIPYRQPNERDAAWSKAASYQRVTNSVGGGGGGGLSGSTGASYTEANAQYSNPQHSALIGGGQANYTYGQPEAVYSSQQRAQPRAPFAYGRR